MDYKTEQEKFWAGEFGDEYLERNTGEAAVASNAALFSRILARTGSLGSILELGANIGLNLRALRRLLPEAELAAIEINREAARRLEEIGGVRVFATSVFDFQPDATWDLVFSKGVLIHIHPDELAPVYELMHRTSRRYILVAEYYNPSPVEVTYRGHAGRLFKRDFAGELLDRFEGLSLVDYGFVYHRDPAAPQDDITW
ncbi:MAG: pseudaminic acid biosynthesis-associated methylase, partial [Planctomycetota bacterium]